jgi:dTMP kinase
MKQNGLLISIEGIDGSGKSTLAKKLHEHISQYHNTLLTKEPGDSELGAHIRAIVQKQDVPVCSKAEYLLFAADRAQHFEQKVIPALQENSIVISDRMADSSVVYQGVARGIDIDFINTVNAWAMCGHRPDVTIFVNTPPEVARKRLIMRNKALTAFEKEHKEFMQHVHDGFCTLFNNRKNVIIIDGERDEQTVLHETLRSLTSWLSDYETKQTSAGTTMDRNAR